LRFRLRLAPDRSDPCGPCDHLEITSTWVGLPWIEPTDGSDVINARHLLRASARSSCAFDIRERPSIPRSFASS
jgi:hypothetical protein